MSIEFPKKYYKISTAYKFELKDDTFYALLLEGKDVFDVYKYMKFSSPIFINSKGDIIEASSFTIKDICNISSDEKYSVFDSIYNILTEKIASIPNFIFRMDFYESINEIIVKLKNIVTQEQYNFMLGDIFFFKDPLSAFQYELNRALDKLS